MNFNAIPLSTTFLSRIRARANFLTPPHHPALIRRSLHSPSFFFFYSRFFPFLFFFFFSFFFFFFHPPFLFPYHDIDKWSTSRVLREWRTRLNERNIKGTTSYALHSSSFSSRYEAKNNGEQSCERVVGSLRLVVVRSRSEDERLDLVHWANSNDQTGKNGSFGYLSRNCFLTTSRLGF